MFLIVIIIAFKLRSITPFFNSDSAFHSISPFTFKVIIRNSISMRALDEYCFSMESSTFPIAFMNVIAWIYDFSMAVWKVVLPMSLISCSVYSPYLQSESIFLSVFPFTCVSVSSIRTHPFFTYRMTIRFNTLSFRLFFLTLFL